MQRLIGRIAVASSVSIALYACGDSGGEGATAIVAGAEVGTDGTSGDDSSSGGPGDGNAPIDAAADTAPAPPSVRFVGRSDTTDAAHPKFGWPGARIIARFSGTDVNVSLNEQSRADGPSRWDVIVDGARTSTLTPTSGTGTYPIVAGLPSAVHTVELYKRTEGKVGVTQFMGYDFPNGGTLLSPPPTPTRRIEFLGDSTTNGYGDECAGPNENFSGATQNERLAYSGLVAHDLNADHHDIAVSGKGVLLNYTRTDTVVFDQFFPRTVPNDDAPAWTFSAFAPDVVWMTLGGNDWDQESAGTAQPNVVAFTNKYITLATIVRSRYGSAHIFVAIAPSLNDDYPVTWNALSNMRTALTNVVSTRAGVGDTKIYKYEFDRATYPTDLTGCGYHGNLGLHRKMADQVIAQIKAKTGWL